MRDVDACNYALGQLEYGDREIVLDVYRNGGRIGDSVPTIARAHGARESHVWATIDDFGRFFAKKRGLID